MTRKPGRHRTTSRIRAFLKRYAILPALGICAAMVVIAATAGAAPANAATTHRHAVAQCWPYSDHGTGNAEVTCLPVSRGLTSWRYLPATGQAWQRGWHYTRCDSLAARIMRRGLVFRCRADGFRLAGWHPVRPDRWRRALIRRLEGFYHAQPDLRRYLYRWTQRHYGAGAPRSLVLALIRWHPYTMGRVIADF